MKYQLLFYDIGSSEELLAQCRKPRTELSRKKDLNKFSSITLLNIFLLCSTIKNLTFYVTRSNVFKLKPNRLYQVLINEHFNTTKTLRTKSDPTNCELLHKKPSMHRRIQGGREGGGPWRVVRHPHPPEVRLGSTNASKDTNDDELIYEGRNFRHITLVE